MSHKMQTPNDIDGTSKALINASDAVMRLLTGAKSDARVEAPSTLDTKIQTKLDDKRASARADALLASDERYLQDRLTATIASRRVALAAKRATMTEEIRDKIARSLAESRAMSALTDEELDTLALAGAVKAGIRTKGSGLNSLTDAPTIDTSDTSDNDN